MREYQLYLFDFDYTLANSEKGILTCFQNVFAANGYRGIQNEAIRKTIGMTLEDAFIQLTGVEDKEMIAGYRKEYVQEANVHMTKNTKLYPETISTLTRLKDAGKQTGIISTKNRYRIEETMQTYQIGHLIDCIIGGEDVKKAKPSPEGIDQALELLKIAKEEVLYVGDSVIDAQAAQNAGVDFAGVTTGVTLAEAFDAYAPVLVMKNLSELCVPVVCL